VPRAAPLAAPASGTRSRASLTPSHGVAGQRRSGTRPHGRARVRGAELPPSNLVAAVATGQAHPRTASRHAGSSRTLRSVSAATGPSRRYLRGALEDVRPLQASSVGHLIKNVPDGIWVALAMLALLTTALTCALALAALRLRREAARANALAGLAHSDELTGLLNRRGLEDRIAVELARARRYGYPLAILYGDLRGLKQVNDASGHHAGDRLLKTTAKILAEEIREGDDCGRIGGDEFGVMLIHQSQEGAEAFCRRVRERMRRSSQPGQRLDLTMGISVFPDDGDTVDELLRVADQRLYAARGITV